MEKPINKIIIAVKLQKVNYTQTQYVFKIILLEAYKNFTLNFEFLQCMTFPNHTQNIIKIVLYKLC
jgi:hypothetical protein